MKKATACIGALAIFAAGAGLALAGPDQDALVIDGVEIATEVDAPDWHPIDRLYSGWRFRSDETQALQTDDFSNPAMVAVDYGAELWDTPMGTSNKSCADCHGGVESMAGLRARAPVWVEAVGKPMNMDQIVRWSMKEHQGAEPWKFDSDELLGMTALISLQSRGMPVDVKIDGPMASWFEKGKELYYTRMGQLDLSCASCHETNWGNMIRADHLSQGQLNGFPTYRLKWGGLGSSHRRLKGCINDVRADAYDKDSDELTAIEVYVSARGQGLMVEAPSVRQ